MGKLLEATKYAFSPGGPVEQVKGQHRPIQMSAAIGLARYVESKFDKPQPWIQEQRAGIGKTLEVLVILSLLKVIHGRNSVVVTFTKNMRTAYLSESQNINRIIQLVLDHLNITTTTKTITFGQYISVTAYFSPAKVKSLKAAIVTKRIVSTDEIAGIIAYYDTCDQHGELPDFDRFFEQGNQLPPHSTILDWCMCSLDKNHSSYKEVVAGNETARDDHILFATHSMLIRSNISRGGVLQTINDEDYPNAPTGALIVDEADKLPAVAYDALTVGVNYNNIIEILNNYQEQVKPQTPQGKQALSNALTAMQPVLDKLKFWRDTHMPPRTLVVNNDDSLAFEFVDYFTEIDNAIAKLRHIVMGNYHDDDRDNILSDQLRNLRQDLRVIRGFKSVHSYPKMAIQTYIDIYGETNLRIYVNLGSGRNLINQLWRTHQTGEPIHSFTSIGFLSATLTDVPKHGTASTTYTWFKRNIGVDINKGDVPIEMPPLPQKRHHHHFGGIGNVIVPARSLYHPTDDTNLPHMINAKFVEWVSIIGLPTMAVKQLNMADDTRMLVLFPSYRLLDEIYDQLPNHLKSRVVRRTRNAHISIDIARYASTPHGIWFGVEMEGTNFVDPNPPKGQLPRTLADILVIVRLPVPPKNEIHESRIYDYFTQKIGATVAAERKAEGVEIHDSIAQCYRKTTQAVGRGIRNPYDVIKDLVFFDIRFPVPQEIVNKSRSIARNGGDKTKMFWMFDTILESYDIQTWSQIDTSGVVKTIYSHP